MSGKNKNTVVIIYVVIAVIFIVSFFVIPFDRNATAWSTFVFGVISIVAGAVITFISFNKGEDLKSKVYGFPMFRLGYYYTIVQLVLSFIFLVAEIFVDIPTWIAVISGLILLGVVVVGTVAIDNVRDVVQQQDVKTKVSTEMMESLRRDVESLARRCDDEKVKKELEKLAEDFRYSDPVSSKKLRK